VACAPTREDRGGVRQDATREGVIPVSEDEALCGRVCEWDEASCENVPDPRGNCGGQELLLARRRSYETVSGVKGEKWVAHTLENAVVEADVEVVGAAKQRRS
jgi:hypothetical protein